MKARRRKPALSPRPKSTAAGMIVSATWERHENQHDDVYYLRADGQIDAAKNDRIRER